jgi:hypothetical protein
MNEANAWAKRALEREREKRGYLCQNVECPFLSWDVDFAHVQETPLTRAPRGRGRKERLADIRKHPHAYILLCRDCHLAFDRHGAELTLTIRKELDSWLPPLRTS